MCLQGGGGIDGIPEEYKVSAANKDSYFARKQAENASRAEGLHPSQGGKYVGFGSSPMPEKSASVNDITSMLSTGWSKFATSATAVASQATTRVSAAAKTIDEQARTGQLTATVQTGAATALTQAQELGTTGWGMLSTLATGVVANVRKLAGDDEEDGAAGGGKKDEARVGASKSGGMNNGDWGGFEDTDSGAGMIAPLAAVDAHRPLLIVEFDMLL
jgi:ADP-ribosylation factor GTPase-activating protein 1